MPYQSKRLSVNLAKRRADTAERKTVDPVNKAIEDMQSLTAHLEDIKDINLAIDSVSSAAPMVTYLEGVQKEDQQDYESYKTAFNELLKERKLKNPNVSSSFPTFKEWQGKTRPSIGGSPIAKSVLDWKAAGVGDDLLMRLVAQGKLTP